MAVYACLSRAFSHGSVEGDYNDVLDVLRSGFTHEAKPIRIAAGKASAHLASHFRLHNRAAWGTKAICEVLKKILSEDNPKLKETGIVTLGYIGRATDFDGLGHVLHCLIAQFGQPYPIFQAVAYVQLLDLARHHRKSPFALLSPYLRDISRFTVERICSEPSYLTETCRFVGRTLPDFLELTLVHTLPMLVGYRAKDPLNAISKQLEKTVCTMIIPHASDILSYILMLEQPNKTDRAFQFLSSLIEEESGKSVSIQMLLNGDRIEIITSLVIAMADEEPERAEMALKAVQKLQRLLAAPKSKITTSASSLGEFLLPFCLGVLSHMNTAITNSRGINAIKQKKQIIRSLGIMIQKVGPSISVVSPQIMAVLHTMINVAALVQETLTTWHIFLTTSAFQDIGPYAGSTTAAIVAGWTHFDAPSRRLGRAIIEYLLLDNGDAIGHYLSEMVSLDDIPEFSKANSRFRELQRSWDRKHLLANLLERSINDNVAVSVRSLSELKHFMVDNNEMLQKASSGDVFDWPTSDIVRALLRSASRDGEGFEEIRGLAFECMGVLGALDPDRLDVVAEESTVTILHNFQDPSENTKFVLHLIQDVLVGAYRSANDMSYQNNLAYALQELLRLCDFTPELLAPSGKSSVEPKVKQRWASLPPHVVETVAALLGGRLYLPEKELEKLPLPIFPSVPTYRQWIQRWSQHLISRVSGVNAKSIFDVFRNIVRNQDVSIAHHMLPHLVLHAVISGEDRDREAILREILAVLEDETPTGVALSPDRRLLSAQTVFMLMDHMNKWIRRARLDLVPKRGRSRPTGVLNFSDLQHHLAKVESVLTSIDHSLMARAAFECKAYARALMNFEQLVLMRQRAHTSEAELQPYYERLHQIYAQLDEPDGMQGVSSKVVAPSLEHQIREHESTGRWTSAQSCWEIKLQQMPDDVNLHIGLLRCLRNLGHYDTLRTHIRGVLSRNNDWFDALAGFQVEGSWMAGDWDGVAEVVRRTTSVAPEIHIGRLLLAIRAGDESSISNGLSEARKYLGSSITAAGRQSYRRSYEAIIHLHQVRELEMIHQTSIKVEELSKDGNHREAQNVFGRLTAQLSSRFEASLPTFRAREPTLSMRRTAFTICFTNCPVAMREIGMTWLASAKIARKSGHSQTAYSATLQANQMSTPFSFIQSSKLTKVNGEGPRALQELETAIQRTVALDDEDEIEHTRMMAKARLLRARWKDETDRFDEKDIARSFTEATDTLKGWESPYFYLGRFYDVLRERVIDTNAVVAADRARLVCKHYIDALSCGSKYIFQTMPRLLTLWLDLTAEKGKGLQESAAQHVQSSANRINLLIEGALKSLPVYQWFTAFPQIVSRIEHPDEAAYAILARLVANVIREYPQQALWLFTTVGLSKRPSRKQRGLEILERLKGLPHGRSMVKKLVDQWEAMSRELLNLCDFPVDNDTTTLPITKFPNLTRLAKSDLILPLQSSMTVTLPSSSSQDEHQPFPLFLPTIRDFGDEVEIMRSLQKPRKVTIIGGDGRSYNWLCKPKDDMRKDARLMDFNSIINKLLKTNSESRRRQLHIRTYSVIPLNEECGLIEWVPNTIGLRFVLAKLYEARGIALYPKPVTEEYERARDRGEKYAAKSLIEITLPQYPPVFHEWFIATFSEPTAWFASRLAYGRTAAVMSMVGYILGLGDRHGENILFDSSTGDAVHVDFNCLFEKGKTFAVPERVPFRLTQNLVDGLGVTGVEGVFRIACEVTMEILRHNKDSLMSVLEAFVHDPLVEWEIENRNVERRNRAANRHRRDAASANPADHMKALAQQSLAPIRRKLEGLSVGQSDRSPKEIKTSNQVEALIKEATDSANLAMMYYGWASWL
ncbi:serine/threonine-protein kinase M1 [Tulasnella sp. 419]|nr:serine/threonine-protein kinase M1 [Tulasnella sp. 419]